MDDPPNTDSDENPIRYKECGALPRAAADTTNMGQFGADALLGKRVQVLGLGVSRAKPEVAVGLLGSVEHSGLSGAVEPIDLHTNTLSPCLCDLGMGKPQT